MRKLVLILISSSLPGWNYTWQIEIHSPSITGTQLHNKNSLWLYSKNESKPYKKDHLMVVNIHLEGQNLQIRHWSSPSHCFFNLSIKSISKFCESWINHFYNECLKLALKKPESLAEQLKNIKLKINGFRWVWGLFVLSKNLFGDYGENQNLHTILLIYISDYLTKPSSHNSILKTIVLCKWLVQLPHKWLQKLLEIK